MDCVDSKVEIGSYRDPRAAHGTTDIDKSIGASHCTQRI